jgi:hypothetical protein
MSIDYKIGRIEEEIEYVNPHKFLVAREGNALVYHSVSSNYQGRNHRDIARLLGIEDKDILGGGHAHLKPSDNKSFILRIYGGSEAYGSVPNQILERFPAKQMLAAYKDLALGIESIIFDTFGKEKQHWAKYGLEEEGENSGQQGNGRTQASPD